MLFPRQGRESASLLLGFQVVTTGMVLHDANGTRELVVPGDILGTGIVSLSQLVSLAHVVRQAVTLDGAWLQAGDLTGDGKISVSDLVSAAVLLRDVTPVSPEPDPEVVSMLEQAAFTAACTFWKDEINFENGIEHADVAEGIRSLYMLAREDDQGFYGRYAADLVAPIAKALGNTKDFAPHGGEGGPSTPVADIAELAVALIGEKGAVDGAEHPISGEGGYYCVGGTVPSHLYDIRCVDGDMSRIDGVHIFEIEWGYDTTLSKRIQVETVEEPESPFGLHLKRVKPL